MEVAVTDSGSILSDRTQDFRAHLSRSGLSQGTVRNYLSDVRKFQRWIRMTKGERVSLFDITSHDVGEYLQHLRAVEGRPDTTIHRNLESIRRFCRFALEARHMASNPAAEIKFTPKRTRTAPKALTDQQEASLLNAVRAGRAGLVPRDHAIVRVLLDTGIRLGELARLRLSDVQVQGEEVTLTIKGYDRGRARQIPLTEATRDAIQAYMNVRNPMPGVVHLFLTRDGRPLSARAVQKMLATHARTADLKDVSANTMRDTYAKRLLHSTRDLALVARRLGHTRLETTVKYVAFGQEDSPEKSQEDSIEHVSRREV